MLSGAIMSKQAKNLRLSKAPLSIRQFMPSPSLNTLALAVSASLLAGAVHAQNQNEGDRAVAEKTESATAQKKRRSSLNTVTVTGKRADGNPYANEKAPYQIERMSSPKYTKPIAETPKTITVVGKEAIKDSGATDLAEVMRSQAGVTLGQGEGGNAFGDRFIIRGFEARNDVFVDGLRDPGVTSREIFAVEQVEIAKGPSSSFAGRGSTGGAVNSVTKKPGTENFNLLSAGIGTDQKQRYTIDSNYVINSDVAVRANVLYADRDVPERGDAEERRKGVALAVAWQATDALKVNADFYNQSGDAIPDGGVPWDAVTGGPVKGSKFYGQKGRDYWDVSSNIGTLGLEYQINDDVKVVNQTRHGKTKNEYVLTVPGLAASPNPPSGTPIGLSTPGVFARATSQTRNQENTYTGNQTNLMWDTRWAGMQHNWVIGAEFSKEEAENLPFTDSLRSPNAGNPSNPNNDAWSQAGGTLVRNPAGYAEMEVKTESFYVMDTVELNKDWSVFAGLRYDTYDYTINSGATAYTGSTEGEIENDENFTNGHFGVVYSPWENGNVYATYSTSSNVSGEQFDSFSNCAYGGMCRSGNGEFPDPEKNTNRELGTKWQLFDKSLLLTAAVFEITKEDVLSSVGSGPALEITQVGELEVKGIEIGLAGNITDRLSAQSGISILHTEITDSDTPAEIGEQFPNTAERSANLQLRYQLTDKFAFGGTATYTGKIYGGTPNGSTTNNSLHSKTIYDFMGEYRFSEDLLARLNVQNAFGKRYYDALYRSGTPFTAIGEGRSATVTVEYSF
jgi:catecholate siderophore receptor